MISYLTIRVGTYVPIVPTYIYFFQLKIAATTAKRDE